MNHETLKNILKRAKISGRRLSIISGVDKNRIGRYLRGEQDIGLEDFLKIRAALPDLYRSEIDELIFGKKIKIADYINSLGNAEAYEALHLIADRLLISPKMRENSDERKFVEAEN